MEELKRCPFCNGEAKIDAYMTEVKGRFVYGIHCRGCQLKTWDHYNSEEEVIKYWNRRIE